MQCEIIAIIIALILIVITYYGKYGFRSDLKNIALMHPSTYHMYDIPYWASAYNNNIPGDKPLDFNILLFTGENFGGWAVPIRKGKRVLLAEQLSPHVKTWHFKSMKIKPGTK